MSRCVYVVLETSHIIIHQMTLTASPSLLKIITEDEEFGQKGKQNSSHMGHKLLCHAHSLGLHTTPGVAASCDYPTPNTTSPFLFPFSYLKKSALHGKVPERKLITTIIMIILSTKAPVSEGSVI